MVQLFLQSIQWRPRWRILQRQYSVVPWTFVVVSLLIHKTTAYHHHPHPYPQPHPSPYSPVQQPYPPQPQPHSLLTGPSATPPSYFYTIDGGNKLVQRQMPPSPSGITAAATNYLLQQLEFERQQQMPQQRSLPPQPPPQAHGNTQALQLLANLTPQQLATLQNIIPTLPRSAPGPFQMLAAANNNAPPSVAVFPPGGHEDAHHHAQSSFASRMGPFDKLINKAKSWLPDMMSSGSSLSSSKSGGNGVGEPKMRDMHRLPKPPQYPLYDIPSLTLATPPPAPIMHPMASLPNSAFDLDQPPISPPMQTSSPRSTQYDQSNSASSFNQQNWMSPSPTMSSKRKSPHRSHPQRPAKPSRPSFLRNPLGRAHKKSRPSAEPPSSYHNSQRRNHGPPPPPSGRQPPPRGGPGPRPRNPSITTKPKKNGPQKARYGSSGRRPPAPGPSSDPFGAQMGFDHPMASNLSPAQSPALGRPLSYEEYMARPSHSYTDDPWNFDPFASQMNQGLHTHALRYNYDPLGMNALDAEANSHLDPNKLSYPGDSFNQDMVKDAPGIQGSSQIGGWDKPFKKRPYNSDPELELTPPGANPGFGSGGGSSSFSSSPNDPYRKSPSSSRGSSSNRYKNSGSGSSGGGSQGSGFLGDALSGGRLGEMPSDPLAGGSDMPSFDSDQGNHDEAPTVDLESLQTQDEDGMSGLEFTIETSMDKGAGSGIEESPQPEPHPLGPMQPAADPYLSDQYNPYGEQSAPVSSSLPGIPYGPNGYRQRYGRRRTRNNHGQQAAVGRRSLKTRVHKPRASTQPASEVPEGVQIFNEIIRPQLVQSKSLSHPQHAALRRQLYNAIRQSAKK